ncbi:hypothetical protein [Brachybacterium tyrofermentans]
MKSLTSLLSAIKVDSFGSTNGSERAGGDDAAHSENVLEHCDRFFADLCGGGPDERCGEELSPIHDSSG